MSCQTTTELTIVQGENKIYEIIVRDQDSTLVDLTGSKIWFSVKHSLAERPYLIHKRTVSAGGLSGEIDILNQALPATLGRARIYLLPSDTSGIELDVVNQFLCDIWVKLASNLQYQVLPILPFKIFNRVTTTI